MNTNFRLRSRWLASLWQRLARERFPWINRFSKRAANSPPTLLNFKEGLLEGGGRRSRRHARGPLGNRNPENNVGKNVWPGNQRSQQPQNSYKCCVNVEVIRDSGADARD